MPTAAREKYGRSKPWYKHLWFYVLLAMILGIILGKFDPGLGVRMQPFGDAFIKLIRMLIAPIIFCTVVHGIARMADIARVGRVALKAIVYFEVLTTIALVVGLVAVNLWQPGRGMNVDLAHVDTSAVQTYVAHPESMSVTQFLTNIIPGSFVGAFTEGNVLQVLLISVLCAFALTQVGSRGKPVVDFIEAASRMMFAVVGIVMWRRRSEPSERLLSPSASLGRARWCRWASCSAAFMSRVSSLCSACYGRWRTGAASAYSN
jgi:aerobic C4-dicarboxylate transport protein